MAHLIAYKQNHTYYAHGMYNFAKPRLLLLFTKIAANAVKKLKYLHFSIKISKKFSKTTLHIADYMV